MLTSTASVTGPGGYALRFDAELYQVADALQHDNPGWLIMGATWRRKFCAFSGLVHTTCVIVESTTAERLVVLMRQVEAEARTTLASP
ncbi:hypothetical protein AB0O34_33960 [Sphaerisporangium sp. NPDC088356]|uniref:hypothetical protein n=1 Tax=Sphaerisporangium sp. NPDC088356 TaxID=3154871 RepID=UPI0034351A9C